MGDSRLESNQAKIAELKERVSTAIRVLGRLGMADWLGHASARVPGTDLFVTSPKGAKRGNVQSFRAQDILVMDLEDHVVDGAAPPPGEFYIHSAIYRRRPDVMGVIHDHQQMTVLFGIARREIRPLHLMSASVVKEPIPVYDSPHAISTPERGRAIAETIGTHCACHMRGHGVVVVGNSVENAAMNAIHLERQAQWNYLACQLGDPAVIAAAAIPLEEVEEFAEFQNPARGGGGGTGAWAYFTSLLES
ncbi:MAG: class II aldolase/adducin family protein [Chloroflexi bacterium]|nr:class II aldolase/adducin family protein [Chloroflexota bacterium]